MGQLISKLKSKVNPKEAEDAPSERVFQVRSKSTTTLNSRGSMSGPSNDSDLKQFTTIYQYKVKDFKGRDIPLSRYQGYVCLVVNVAANCGFTKRHYKELNEIYDEYADKGLRILAFPCEQFMSKEPQCETDMVEMIRKFGIKFDMFDKILVNGEGADPLFKFLKSKLGGALGMDFIKWNFTKFLVDHEGVPYKRYPPTVPPKALEADLIELLSKRNVNHKKQSENREVRTMDFSERDSEGMEPESITRVEEESSRRNHSEKEQNGAKMSERKSLEAENRLAPLKIKKHEEARLLVGAPPKTPKPINAP